MKCASPVDNFMKLETTPAANQRKARRQLAALMYMSGVPVVDLAKELGKSEAHVRRLILNGLQDAAAYHRVTPPGSIRNLDPSWYWRLVTVPDGL